MSRRVIFFFFSSRRRHTIYWRDWSSDVCSSDLGPGAAGRRTRNGATGGPWGTSRGRPAGWCAPLDGRPVCPPRQSPLPADRTRVETAARRREEAPVQIAHLLRRKGPDVVTVAPDRKSVV